MLFTSWSLNSPGLVVMGGDARSEGRELESQERILYGHLKNRICCNISHSTAIKCQFLATKINR